MARQTEETSAQSSWIPDDEVAASGRPQTLGRNDAVPATVGLRDGVLDRDVVVVGGGFAGLACAEALGGADVSVLVVDRRNYHLFQPLLYQVATAALSPADIAEPIRKILSRHRNIDVAMAEATAVDVAARLVRFEGLSPVRYRRLVLATGSEYNYFGHEAWKQLAPGLKTIDDARTIRSRLLGNFERAETCDDAARRDALMTTVVIGGGPTGVEMAGAIAELARWTLARDFRHIDPTRARVILIEAAPRLLGAFPEDLASYAREQLERLGVTVVTGRPVEAVHEDHVVIGGDRQPTGLVVWGAGIRASSAADLLGVQGDRIGRLRVRPDLSIEDHPDIHALGDVSLLEQDGSALPALAQVAKQQGEHLGRHLADAVLHGTPIPPFRFRSRGNTAVIGRNAAVFDFGRRRLKGRFAWILWAIVHVYLLVGFDKRLLVTMQWLWRYLTYQRGARIIR